jgi:hypothetical protein
MIEALELVREHFGLASRSDALRVVLGRGFGALAPTMV